MEKKVTSCVKDDEKPLDIIVTSYEHERLREQQVKENLESMLRRSRLSPYVEPHRLDISSFLTSR